LPLLEIAQSKTLFEAISSVSDDIWRQFDREAAQFTTEAGETPTLTRKDPAFYLALASVPAATISALKLKSVVEFSVITLTALGSLDSAVIPELLKRINIVDLATRDLIDGETEQTGEEQNYTTEKIASSLAFISTTKPKHLEALKPEIEPRALIMLSEKDLLNHLVRAKKRRPEIVALFTQTRMRKVNEIDPKQRNLLFRRLNQMSPEVVTRFDNCESLDFIDIILRLPEPTWMMLSGNKKKFDTNLAKSENLHLLKQIVELVQSNENQEENCKLIAQAELFTGGNSETFSNLLTNISNGTSISKFLSGIDAMIISQFSENGKLDSKHLQFKILLLAKHWLTVKQETMSPW